MQRVVKDWPIWPVDDSIAAGILTDGMSKSESPSSSPRMCEGRSVQDCIGCTWWAANGWLQEFFASLITHNQTTIDHSLSKSIKEWASACSLSTNLLSGEISGWTGSEIVRNWTLRIPTLTERLCEQYKSLLLHGLLYVLCGHRPDFYRSQQLRHWYLRMSTYPDVLENAHQWITCYDKCIVIAW